METKIFFTKEGLPQGLPTLMVSVCETCTGVLFTKEWMDGIEPTAAHQEVLVHVNRDDNCGGCAESTCDDHDTLLECGETCDNELEPRNDFGPLYLFSMMHAGEEAVKGQTVPSNTLGIDVASRVYSFSYHTLAEDAWAIESCE